MKIKEIEIKNFKKYHDEKITFNDQINVVLGNNESGKSTLIDAIFTVLYTSQSKGVIKELEQQRTWGIEKLPLLKLKISTENDTLILTKNFENREENIIFNKTDKRYNNSNNIKKIIQKLTGITEEYIYKNTGIIQSYYMSLELSPDKKKLARVLQQVSVGTSSDKDIQLLIAKLQKQSAELKLGLDRASKNPGIIRQKQDNLVRLTDELNTLKSKWNILQNSLKTNDSEKTNIEKLKKNIDDLKQFIENCGLYEEAKKEFDQLEIQIIDSENRIKGAKTAQERKQEIEKRLKEYGVTNEEIELLTKELQGYIKRKKEIKQELEELKKLIDSKNLSLKESTNKKNNNLLNIVISIIAVVLGVGLSIYLNNWIFTILSSIIIVVVSFILNRKGTTQNSAILEEIEQVNRKYQDKEREYSEEEKKITGVLGKFKIGSEEQFFEKKAMLIGDIQYLKELDSVIFEYMQDSTIDDLEHKQRTLMLRKKELELTSIRQYKDFNISKDQLFFKKRELQKLEDEYEKIRDKQIESQTRLKDADVDWDKIVEKEEQLELIKTDLEASLKRLKVIEIVLENLEQALKNTAVGVSEYIKMEIEKYLPLITENKYTKVKVQDDFTILVFSPEKADWVDTSVLSTGTINQIYFLARLAYFKSIIGEARPPIIIDDAFVSFDQNRLKHLKTILKEVSEEFQILLFTCHPEFKTWGNLIELK